MKDEVVVARPEEMLPKTFVLNLQALGVEINLFQATRLDSIVPVLPIIDTRELICLGVINIEHGTDMDIVHFKEFAAWTKKSVSKMKKYNL